jgi:hypothetical protein
LPDLHWQQLQALQRQSLHLQHAQALASVLTTFMVLSVDGDGGMPWNEA